MPYNANIPLATDKLSSSQVDINNNFQGINTYVSVDHVPFANTANQGKHQMVTFPISAAPAVSVAGFIGLYGANDLVGNPAIFVNNVVPGKQIPMTSADAAATGWTYLPSGIIMKWGNSTTNSPTLFPVGATIPVFTNVFSAQLTLLSDSHLHYWIEITKTGPNALTTTGFTAHSEDGNGNASAQSFYYLVIGN
jgi:hypothetical protein